MITGISIAESLAGVQIIRLNLPHPTPGLGRNSGWSNNSAPFVQFLDSDTLLDPYWLQTGIMAFEQDIAAVMGNRLETNTTGSVFNWIANLEWNGRPGDAESFGGDVMIRRTALEETGGYDEVLVGGEDPELSRRIRLNGWRIRQMDANMTYHDLAMTTVLSVPQKSISFRLWICRCGRSILLTYPTLSGKRNFGVFSSVEAGFLGFVSWLSLLPWPTCPPLMA